MDQVMPTNTAIDANRIRELIPHAGTMCLLERVVGCDQTSIRCETRSHQNDNNPLRYKGRLSSVCGIEYAAQAMALHGALKSGAIDTSALRSGAPMPDIMKAGTQTRAMSELIPLNHGVDSISINDADERPLPPKTRHGFLASVRDTRIYRHYMDDLDCPLTISAVLEFDDALRVIYSFSLEAGDSRLISGRAAVVLR
jgi:predicted hotdog family 3-hydroxylacyl-ACP dehydratase